MNTTLRRDADEIICSSIQAVLPDKAVCRALENFQPGGGRVLLVAAGKAAWQMAHAAVQTLGRVDGGVVVTKYGHVKGRIPGISCYEAGHPVPDANSFAATEKALALVQGLTAEDTVLFLLSGGGSALFEKPLVPGGELQDITNQLLASGADIVEMNTIRKRLSAVKGGRFAQHCAPARVFSIVLSDILGDPLDMIASGPAVPDSSTCAQALTIAEKYHLNLSEQAKALLAQETPKALDNVTTQITGSVRELCTAAAKACRELGYEPILLTDRLCCEAREAGSFLGAIARTHAGQGKKLAFIAGGETVVHLTGKGLGGRNQELLAYLVDRNGATCTNGEMLAVLWEDKPDTASLHSHLRNLIFDLSHTLEDAGVNGLLVRGRSTLALDTSKVDCDYYNFLRGDRSAFNSYRGEYMTQYSWAEVTRSALRQQAAAMPKSGSIPSYYVPPTGF